MSSLNIELQAQDEAAHPNSSWPNETPKLHYPPNQIHISKHSTTHVKKMNSYPMDTMQTPQHYTSATPPCTANHALLTNHPKSEHTSTQLFLVGNNNLHMLDQKPNVTLQLCHCRQANNSAQNQPA